MKRGWNGQAPASAYDLRSRVHEYEALVGKAAEAGGYGNIVLADSLRRLSLTLLIEFVLAHPAEYATVSDLLAEGRVRLLDAPALTDMLTTDLGAAVPAGPLRLSTTKPGQLEALLRVVDPKVRDATGRLLWGLPASSALVSHRDGVGLVLRLVETYSLEHVNLSGFIEFWKQGGRLDDIQMYDVTPFLRVMEQKRRNFTCPPLGINMLRMEHLYALIHGFDGQGRKPSAFTMLALQ
jgi:hypothetical protein